MSEMFLKLIFMLFAFVDVVVVLPQLSFPEHVALGKKKSNAQGRWPVYSPSNCKSNELLYPGDLVGDWICDCAPGAVYYPETDNCYPVFRQGPCLKAEFLVLGPNKVIPECIGNACQEDGKVLINNVCYAIGQKGPCPLPELSYVVGVNITTLTLDCINLSIDLHTRFAEIDLGQTTTPTPRNLNNNKIDICARGCKRAIQGRCPE